MKPRYWILIAVLVSVLALIVAIVMIFAKSSGPHGYVADRYTRAAHLDIPGDDDNEAYTSPKAPQLVVREITAQWRPQSESSDATGIYLRYSDDAIVIQPHAPGSVIHLMDAEDAYRRHHTHLSGIWAWSSTYEESFRGGGPGEGK